MEIKPNEIIQELQNVFPKEFQICVQAIQIRKLQAALEPGTMDEVENA